MLQSIVEPNPTINEHELELFTTRRGVRLPKQYEEFLLTTNGGQPVPSAFPITGFADNPLGVVQALFGVKANLATEDLDKILSELQGTVPKGIFPIACTEGDDFLVLDLRKPNAPVLFWDRKPFWGSSTWNEADLYPVSNDFSTFLHALHEP